MKTRLAWIGVLATFALGYAIYPGRSGRQASSELTVAEIQNFCSKCHKYTPPYVLPKHAWAKRIRMMYEFLESGVATKPMPAPPMDPVIDYFELHAPDDLPPLVSDSSLDPKIPFELVEITLGNTTPYPGVANVSFVEMDEGQSHLLVSEMRYGGIAQLTPADGFASVDIVGDVSNPCRVDVVDLDGDGRRDLLVSNLGSLPPTDKRTGSVVWLRQAEGGAFVPRTLLQNVGRVADAQAADFDGDGDLDVVVAAFGWRKVGSIVLLENITRSNEPLEFEPHLLDDRPGTIHVPVLDLNQDGRPDFIALISQQHECVVAFLNTGGGTFTQQTIFSAEHPNWGSSGIDVADLDNDGDWDVVLANGDSLDDLVLKPYHGVTWLENRGGFPFTPRVLTNAYGVTAVKAADLDLDGDLDVVASVCLPQIDPASDLGKSIDSVFWLEQDAPGSFRRRRLKSGGATHAALDVADCDNDGDPDVILGSFTLPEIFRTTTSFWVAILRNQTPSR